MLVKVGKVLLAKAWFVMTDASLMDNAKTVPVPAGTDSTANTVHWLAAVRMLAATVMGSARPKE